MSSHSQKPNTQKPRGIAVADVGYTHTKLILLSDELEILAERKIASPHRKGLNYSEIDAELMLQFFAQELPELDRIAPIDVVVTSAHGACIAALDGDGRLTVPLMDYMSQPPPEIVAAYTKACPSYNETSSPQLPVALLHAMQLFWQQRILPEEFARTQTILPLMQYVAHRLGGRAVTEISSMGCQTHLLDMNSFEPSSLARAEGWGSKFAPRAKAWESIGTLKPEFRGAAFNGKGTILAGIHDSNANYLRYLAAGVRDFTLLSTGTWIIGFDTGADIRGLDPAKDIVANMDVFGRRVASCRFFGGREFEIVSGGADGSLASLDTVREIVTKGVMTLPSFTESGGPLPGTGNRGRITAKLTTDVERASLASLYCALMVSESLDAIQSKADIIVDGPFAKNHVFLACLAALRPAQCVKASDLRDGTAAGAACLALMPDGVLPRIHIDMSEIAPAAIDLAIYQAQWRKEAVCQ
jgi:sugar (pentulose or hexulose) kinase